MSLPDPRLHAAMQAAVQIILSTVSTASSRMVDALGMLALSAASNAQRQSFMSAQFDLQRKLSAFNMSFTTVLNEKVAKELNPRVARSLAATDWASLSLVGDSEVEEQVTAHRLSLEIEHECEWELRELDAYIGSLLGIGRADPERNPIRPEILGQALFRSIEAVTPDPGVRKTLAAELGRALAKAMRPCYGAIVSDFGARGIHPVGLAVKAGVPGVAAGYDPTAAHAGGAAPMPPAPPGLKHDWQQAAQALGSMFGMAVPANFGATGAGALAGGFGPTSSGGGTLHSGPGSLGAGRAASDAHMLDVIRRLAFAASTPGALDAVSGWAAGGTVSPAGAGPASGPGTLSGALNNGLSGLMAVNLIRTHREELMRASTGALDHMVIDIVASLFDQILSDTKVPPQMARQIARLQLPVLRAALKDMQFFSSRSHPVRRFVNRMASIACAFEDFDEGAGRRFLELVRELVQQVVDGDFDQMDQYDTKLRALEAFVHEQSRDEAQAHVEAVELLAQKEAKLRIHARFAEQMQSMLRPVAVQDFIRGFLHDTWTLVQVEAALRHGPDSDVAKRLRGMPRQLILSVLPKGTPAERKQFILALPQLMKGLNEGLALIRWPEDRKKAFFGELLPCHAQSLKGQPLTDFQYRQLDTQLQALDHMAIPTAEEVPLSQAAAPTSEQITSFSLEEAAQVGLVEEAAIDWDGNVDIDLESLDSSSGELDINLEGLGPEMAPETPTRGVQLAQYVQAGVAYQMHTEEGWRKVRLNWVSPGRTFFIFNHGKKHQKIISMTGRMLTKLCETGRFRAFEQAYLIERAVARARKQLAALSSKS
ncbi:DUF1631 domain-containing protein [Schlegelella sp. S2-27]|uniref:DUF1631 domain-containing protein n=1 Tax=Caldimonas mangrovi TaxID=2944811 RepID=A0ABT0YPP4_9BURK|nr:DUF1631 family protein [Caldimonas mangrovi]MCM5680710.1 DUF1631 domain-containing protein [Caldimonas mangrovi]